MDHPLTLADLGVPHEQSDTLSVAHAALAAATFNRPYNPDAPLPLLWHWLFFNPTVATTALGVDGHPARADEFGRSFPRRMWVGGRINRSGDLIVGHEATRRTHLVGAQRKTGSTGDLYIVTLHHTIEQFGRTVIEEHQDVVYREAGGTTATPGTVVDPGPPESDGWRHVVHPSTALLFRFSALTFNSHRIHYDHNYATTVEGYPALVVHGPLTAMLIAEAANAHMVETPHTFAFRAMQPLFVDQPIRIDGTTSQLVATAPATTAATTTATTASTTVTATRLDGVTAMIATIT